MSVQLSLIQAREREAEVRKSDVTKLEVVNFDEAEVESDLGQSDVQHKRDSGLSYSRPNRVAASSRFRLQAPNRSRGHHIASRIPTGQLVRPFVRYGPPSYSSPDASPIAHGGYPDKLQQHAVSQQQSIDGEPSEQGVPSPIRNVDFAEANPIASQNNEPFGMHTANYLPPRNQKLPAYAPTGGSFTPSPSQNLARPPDHQISDAALFLAENAQAIRQLYSVPASDQDFAPSYDQLRDAGDRIPNPSDEFRNSEFRGALPSYASGTLDPRETLEQIQSLEKDRLIAQLQRALVHARTTVTPDRYAQDQTSFVQSQDLLASIGQRTKTHATSTTPQTAILGNTVFGQASAFLPSTTVDPVGFPLDYGAPTTAQTPATTTTTTLTGTPVAPSRPPQPFSDGSADRPGPSAITSPAGVPIYGGFVPTFIAGTNLHVPSYSTSTSVFASSSGPVRPVQPALGSSPTHFGIPIPTESSQKPALGPAVPATTTTTTVSSVSPPGRPAVALTPAITPVALLPPIRPVAATPVHPIVAAALPAGPAQAHPVQATPAVTSTVPHPTYGLQTALINPVLYKPVKAVYPVYYYPNVAYQLQKPALPSYPWNYAPSYAQTKPAQIWK